MRFCVCQGRLGEGRLKGCSGVTCKVCERIGLTRDVMGPCTGADELRIWLVGWFMFGVIMCAFRIDIWIGKAASSPFHLFYFSSFFFLFFFAWNSLREGG